MINEALLLICISTLTIISLIISCVLSQASNIPGGAGFPKTSVIDSAGTSLGAPHPAVAMTSVIATIDHDSCRSHEWCFWIPLWKLLRASIGVIPTYVGVSYIYSTAFAINIYRFCL